MSRSGFSRFFNKKPLGSLYFFFLIPPMLSIFMLGSGLGHLKWLFLIFCNTESPFRSLRLFLLLLLIFLVSLLCSSGQRDKFSFLINSFMSLFSHKSYFHAFCKHNTRTECLFILHWVFFSLKLLCNARNCLVLFSFSQISIIGQYTRISLIHVTYPLPNT